MNEPAVPAPTKKSFRPRLVFLAKLLVFALVVGGIWRRVAAHLDELTAERTLEELVRAIDARWLALSAVLYLASLAPAAWFWRHVLGRLGEEVSWRNVTRAYFVGHLGKYVPGKALVLVIRAALLPGCQKAVAVVAIFYETLTLMATCGLVSAAVLGIQWLSRPEAAASGLWSLLALALAGVTLFPVLPPVFAQIYQRLGGSRLVPQMEDRVARLRLVDLLFGIALNVPATFLLGLSLWATLNALSPEGAPLSECAIDTAVMSLSMVAGFVSLIPGGFGVREFILLELLAPQVGDRLAIEATVVSRLVSIAAEAALAALLYGMGAGAPARDASPARDPQ